MKLKLSLFYCYACRWFFEFSTIIGSYFILPTKWAVMISAAWILWQILSYTVLLKNYNIKMTPKTEQE